MPSKADVIVGLQWGDEGKGRIVDLYAADYDVVARFGGGDNAGHSIVVGDRELALRIVPSGVMHSHVELFVGGGTVVNLRTLIAELDGLAALGLDISRLKISDRAHIVFPYHVARDAAAERARTNAIGTTGRGIGPAYVDRVARTGILFADLSQAATLAEKIRASFDSAQDDKVGAQDDKVGAQDDKVGAQDDKVGARDDKVGARDDKVGAQDDKVGARDDKVGAQDDMAEETIEETLVAAKRLAPHVVDGVAYIHERLAAGKRVLLEGAQGSLLDVGYGTYPYVTSSHTIAGGACTGLGIGPGAIGRVIGVLKAYCTRVGAGPLPSELNDERGERLRRQGDEYGTVTGRPRRCGWLDAVAAQYAVELNGLTAAALTKLDVLGGFERLGIVTGYRLEGKRVGFAAAAAPGLELEVEELPGWSESIGACREIANLPAAARAYVARVEALLGVPVDLVSVGRERSELAR